MVVKKRVPLPSIVWLVPFHCSVALMRLSSDVILMMIWYPVIVVSFSEVGLTISTVGVTLSNDETALATSILVKNLPEPEVSLMITPVELSVVLMSLVLIFLRCSKLLNCCRRAIAPAAWGVAIDVPELLTKVPLS